MNELGEGDVTTGTKHVKGPEVIGMGNIPELGAADNMCIRGVHRLDRMQSHLNNMAAE